MYEIYFAFGLPVRANIRSGRAAVRRCPSLSVAVRRCPSLPVAARRCPSLPGSERTRNGRNGISGMADLSSGLSEKRWFYKMRLGLARPTDDRSGYRRLSWISPRKEEKC